MFVSPEIALSLLAEFKDMLVLLTRALEEGKRTEARLNEAGHEAILSPVLEMVPTGARWPEGAADAIIAASARAFELLSIEPEWPLPEARRLLPLALVGERTLQAARERGFEGRAFVAPDAKALAQRLEGGFFDSSRVIYLAGRDRKACIEDTLTKAGHITTLIEVYAAQPAESLTDEALIRARSGEIGAVLHYSNRSAGIFLSLARKAGLRLSRLNHVCISADAAAPLLAAGLNEVLIGKSPDEQAMLAIVNVLAGLPQAPLRQDEGELL